MKMESLANELLLDIFEYFTAIELLRSFHQINHRFNQLLYLHFQKCPLDFRSICKKDFDSICQNHLPSITDRIISIHLSNEDETPDQPHLFLAHDLHFEEFLHLQSLSLYHIHSTQLIHGIISHCPQLTYLNISKCNFDDDLDQAKICMNQIWSLSKLCCCYLNDFFVSFLTTTSTSLQELSLENHPLSVNCLLSLFQHTPNLRNLKVQIRDISDDQPFTFPLPFLTKLTIDFRGDFNPLINLLENLPNLSKLVIHISDLYMTGYQWEEIITDHLSKLKIFRLLMSYQFDQTKDIAEEFDQLFQSFQTKFWIEEHQWFIRCDAQIESRSIHLYTLPYGFQDFFNYHCDRSESTGLKSRSFDRVHRLIFENTLSQLASLFPSIRALELAFPFDDTLWSVIPNFHRLTSLEIVSVTHSDEFEQSTTRLRQILDRAAHLYSLTIDYLILSQLSTIPMTNPSIRRLDLMVNDGHFYGLECIPLIQSFLADRCEVLLINIENRSIILDLMEKMPRLRALICQCQDDQWDDSHQSSFNDNDELIQWLKARLPSTCSIIRDENEISAIRLWLR